MLLNEAERLGVLFGRTLRIMELALTELHWSAFESWIEFLRPDFWRRPSARTRIQMLKGPPPLQMMMSRVKPGRGRPPPCWTMTSRREITGENKGGRKRERAQHATFIMAFPPLHDTREMANYMRESFRWRWRRATRPPFPLLDDYQDLCPCFSLSKAERAVLGFEFPEMVYATFYAMLLNDAVELRIASGFLASDLRLSLEDLFPNFTSTEQAAKYVQDTCCWTLRESLAPDTKLLPMDYHDLCPHFDVRVATRYAHNFNIPEMVLAILYAMVVDDAVELGY
ncbi:hypothetical protein Cgig2_015472 [Carnegiea gigantea]|uniref:Uncharacterized protein n=1 Tax=Carnegiea gigantea TaxID=171969 RepID=A0A9Q1GK81_9CARY|nr:hypothetical protein Cgig2_015472 [Carnegiea gigantea]